MAAPAAGPKHVKLTTMQGCLMTAGIAAVFLAIAFWSWSANAQRIDGTVKGETFSLEPFGCTADRVKNILTIPLKDATPHEGFREENRALILEDTGTMPATRSGRPVEGPMISYRDEERNRVELSCDVIRNDLRIRTARRSSGGTRRLSEDRWGGMLEAACRSEKTGEFEVKLEMENCD